MKEIKKPQPYGPVLSSVVAFLAMIGMGLTASQSGMSLKLRVISLALNSLLILLSLAQWPIYLKSYVEYKFQEMEKINIK